MIVADATAGSDRKMWKQFRRRLHGCVARALTATSPRESWRSSLPRIAADARAAMEASLVLELRRAGVDPDPAWIDQHFIDRDLAAELLDIGGKRAVELLVAAGVEQRSAARLVAAVGVDDVASAVRFLDVIDAVFADQVRARGAA